MSAPIIDRTVSKTLADVATPFVQGGGKATIVEVEDAALLGLVLMQLSQLAASMETELALYRSCDDGRQVRHSMETAAEHALSEMTEDPEGKVIHADFGGRS